ncbi:hypothetical protein QBC47DRAFT_26514 [Echria macrotheca]|uniref:Uncharacterized protein n=1 Tax=Echria macrotheca TaxID=438768 RepID=A0AAJ0BQ41_9PEZI|nr:hypothetical protein QBC47DRAFT_26514 [Echria macrotheca]
MLCPRASMGGFAGTATRAQSYPKWDQGANGNMDGNVTTRPPYSLLLLHWPKDQRFGRVTKAASCTTCRLPLGCPPPAKTCGKEWASADRNMATKKSLGKFLPSGAPTSGGSAIHLHPFHQQSVGSRVLLPARCRDMAAPDGSSASKGAGAVRRGLACHRTVICRLFGSRPAWTHYTMTISCGVVGGRGAALHCSSGRSGRKARHLYKDILARSCLPPWHPLPCPVAATMGGRSMLKFFILLFIRPLPYLLPHRRHFGRRRLTQATALRRIFGGRACVFTCTRLGRVVVWLGQRLVRMEIRTALPLLPARCPRPVSETLLSSLTQ